VSVSRPRRLEPAEIERLDPYAFMAVIGKRVIHPGGRAATEQLLERAAIDADTKVLDAACGVGTTGCWFESNPGSKERALRVPFRVLVGVTRREFSAR
jgi:hypothetical protein